MIGEYLGDALQSNQTLQTLLLESNQLNGIACFCICVGILENTSLRRISLDKNPIGQNYDYLYLSYIMHVYSE